MKFSGHVCSAMAFAVALALSGPAAAQEMVSFKVVDNAVAQPLTDKPGDVKNGRNVVVGMRKGNCLACHVMPIPEEPFHGLVGPDLTGVASRLNEGELRARIINAKLMNSDTAMPAFYRVDGLNRVAKAHQDKTILTAQEVEDVVAYLKTLK